LAGYFGVDLGNILTLATTEKKDRQSFESAKRIHVAAAAAAAAAVFTERDGEDAIGKRTNMY
jgi:limonene-1,2-epoxide hydrolase